MSSEHSADVAKLLRRFRREEWEHTVTEKALITASIDKAFIAVFHSVGSTFCVLLATQDVEASRRMLQEGSCEPVDLFLTKQVEPKEKLFEAMDFVLCRVSELGCPRVVTNMHMPPFIPTPVEVITRCHRTSDAQAFTNFVRDALSEWETKLL